MASLRVGVLDVAGIQLDTLRATVRFEAARAGEFTIGALSKNHVTFDAHGEITRADSSARVTLRDVALVTDSSRWSLRGPTNVSWDSRLVSIDSLVLANGKGGRISVEGMVPEVGRARMLLRADSVSLHDVGSVLQVRAPFSGWLSAAAQGAGTSAAPIMSMQASLKDVRYGGVHVEQVAATADYASNRAQVALDLGRGGRASLLARGSLPLELKYFGMRLLDDTLRATVREPRPRRGIGPRTPRRHGKARRQH
jgi:hypothetical protein